MLNLFKKPAFGIDISDYSIETLQLSFKRQIKSFGRVVLEPGIVQDGIILDNVKLVKKIQEAVSMPKIKAKRVIFSIPESRVFVYSFKVPENLKGEALEGAVEDGASKIIPLEKKKIYWDFIEAGIISPGVKRILYVGASKEIIDSYIQVLNKSGLNPVIFDIESMALARALLKPKGYFSILEGDSLSDVDKMIVDIGARATNISIFDDDRNLRFSSTLKIGGNQFTKAISDNLNIPKDAAEKLKRIHGLDPLTEETRIMSILQKEIKPIIQEIKKIINFHKRGISKLLLAGGSARMPKIVEYFSVSLGLKTVVAKSLIINQLKINPSDASILFNTVIGSALRAIFKNPEKSGINLLPKIERTQKRTKPRLLYIGIGIIIIVIVFLGWIIFKPAPPVDEPVQETEVIIETEIIPAAPEESEPSPRGEAAGRPEDSGREEIIVVEKVIIKQTETGWLNVRSGPGTGYAVLVKIYSGESHILLEETQGWYKIELKDKTEGWISARYALKE